MKQNNISKLKKMIIEALDEMTTTGDVGGYNSAYAFSKNTKKMGDYFENQGYDVVEDDAVSNDDAQKNRKQNDKLNMLVTNVLSNMLGESNYKQFKNDESTSSKQKINRTIKEINSDLFKLERSLDQVIKLKTEEQINSETGYWKPTKSNLKKIQDRLNRITIKVKKLN